MLDPIDYRESTTTGYFFTPGTYIKQLNVEHPDDLKQYLAQIPKVVSINFDFSKSAFNKSFDEYEQVKQGILLTRLERLKIRSCNNMAILPDELENHRLRQLEIEYCNTLNDLSNILYEFQNLEFLSINQYSGHFNFGEQFPQLKNLKILRINSDTTSSLEKLDTCTSLVELSINVKGIPRIPEAISKLVNLKKLTIYGNENIDTFPNLSTLTQLEHLQINECPNLKILDFGILKSLKLLKLNNIGTQNKDFYSTDAIVNCISLEEIIFHKVRLRDFIFDYSKLNKLTNLRLEWLLDEIISGVFGSMIHLTRLLISGSQSLTKLPDDLASLSNLEILTLTYLTKIREIELDFSKLSSLKNLYMENLKDLVLITSPLKDNKLLEVITIQNCDNLLEYPELGDSNVKLRGITLGSNNTITHIPNSICKVPNLISVNIYSRLMMSLPLDLYKASTLENISSRTLEYIHPYIGKLKNLKTLDVYIRPDEKEQRDILEIRNLFSKINEIQDQDLKESFYFWIGKAYRNMEVTTHFKKMYLQILHSSIPNLHIEILKKIKYLNQNHEEVSAKSISKSNTVWVNGTVQGSKTLLKDQLTALGLKVKSKYNSNLDLIIIGKKPEYCDGLFDCTSKFANQEQIVNIKKEEAPSLLEEKNVDTSFLSNIQALIWSADPANEALALELVKKNGLPSEIEDDFLYLSKVCTDKNLKSRIKSFLKGSLSAVKQKAISVGNASFKIDKLRYILDPKTLSNMYFAEYKRKGKLDPSFFTMDNGNHPGRAEAFNHLMDHLTSNSGYFLFYGDLLEKEIDELFGNGAFNGNLKRINISLGLCTNVPQGILNHKESLKILEFRNLKNISDISPIYELYKLNELILGDFAIDQVPKGINKLKRLRTLRINPAFHIIKSITMPNDFKELIHLKHGFISGLKNQKDFEGLIPLFSS